MSYNENNNNGMIPFFPSHLSSSSDRYYADSFYDYGYYDESDDGYSFMNSCLKVVENGVYTGRMKTIMNDDYFNMISSELGILDGDKALMEDEYCNTLNLIDEKYCDGGEFHKFALTLELGGSSIPFGDATIKQTVIAGGVRDLISAVYDLNDFHSVRVTKRSKLIFYWDDREESRNVNSDLLNQLGIVMFNRYLNSLTVNDEIEDKSSAFTRYLNQVWKMDLSVKQLNFNLDAIVSDGEKEIVGKVQFGEVVVNFYSAVVGNVETISQSLNNHTLARIFVIYHMSRFFAHSSDRDLSVDSMAKAVLMIFGLIYEAKEYKGLSMLRIMRRIFLDLSEMDKDDVAVTSFLNSKREKYIRIGSVNQRIKDTIAKKQSQIDKLQTECTLSEKKIHSLENEVKSLKNEMSGQSNSLDMYEADNRELGAKVVLLQDNIFNLESALSREKVEVSRVDLLLSENEILRAKITSLVGVTEKLREAEQEILSLKESAVVSLDPPPDERDGMEIDGSMDWKVDARKTSMVANSSQIGMLNEYQQMGYVANMSFDTVVSDNYTATGPLWNCLLVLDTRFGRCRAEVVNAASKRKAKNLVAALMVKEMSQELGING